MGLTTQELRSRSSKRATGVPKKTHTLFFLNQALELVCLSFFEVVLDCPFNMGIWDFLLREKTIPNAQTELAEAKQHRGKKIKLGRGERSVLTRPQRAYEINQRDKRRHFLRSGAVTRSQFDL